MIAAEQETTITYDNEQKLVRIFTARLGDQGKLRRAGVHPIRGSTARGFFYELPLNRLKWRVTPESHSNPRVRNVNLSGLVKHRASLHRKGIPE